MDSLEASIGGGIKQIVSWHSVSYRNWRKAADSAELGLPCGSAIEDDGSITLDFGDICGDSAFGVAKVCRIDANGDFAMCAEGGRIASGLPADKRGDAYIAIGDICHKYAELGDFLREGAALSALHGAICSWECLGLAEYDLKGGEGV